MFIGSRGYVSAEGNSFRVGEHPINAGHADLQSASNFLSLQSLVRQSQNLISLGTRGWFPALVFSIELCFRHAFSLTFQQQTAFEFGNGAEHGDHEPTGW